MYLQNENSSYNVVLIAMLSKIIPLNVNALLTLIGAELLCESAK